MLFRVFAVHLRSPDHTMLALLSPAKDLNMEPMPPLKGATQPVFLEQSSVLICLLYTSPSPRDRG